MPLDLSRRGFTLGLLASAAAVPAIAGATVEDPFLIGLDPGSKETTAVLRVTWDRGLSPTHPKADVRYIIERVVPVRDGKASVDWEDIRAAFPQMPPGDPVQIQARYVFADRSAGAWSPA